MDKQLIIEELKKIIGDYLVAKGLDLVDLIYRYEGRDLYLRILADRPEGGITIDECTNLNRQISAVLDEKDIFEASYILEVSSPGLDRPLKTEKDFLRCLGRQAKFFLIEPVNGKIEWDGIIKKVENESVLIDVKAEVLEIPLTKINKAKQII
ncbi:MAG: ribosome maturation factor RimP [Candidatus Omnitrophica bacterium]|nr:ribosome maturation factor RimP [Candidatus Omnitrophota bacterium]MBU1869869.1 ribosome maturation factor RimP [Candidatus Omnitrophota bacterium]